MFNFLKNIFTTTEEENDVFKILPGTDGRFYIINARTNNIAVDTSYSRERDAKRGAQRRGLVLA